MFRFLKCLGAHNWDNGTRLPLINGEIESNPVLCGAFSRSMIEPKYFKCKVCGKGKWFNGIPVSYINSSQS